MKTDSFPKYRQTSKAWYEQFIKTHKTRIVNPIGWDQINYRYAFYEEEITEDEFFERLLSSECTGIVEDWKDNNIGWK